MVASVLPSGENASGPSARANRSITSPVPSRSRCQRTPAGLRLPIAARTFPSGEKAIWRHVGVLPALEAPEQGAVADSPQPDFRPDASPPPRPGSFHRARTRDWSGRYCPSIAIAPDSAEVSDVPEVDGSSPRRSPAGGSRRRARTRSIPERASFQRPGVPGAGVSWWRRPRAGGSRRCSRSRRSCHRERRRPFRRCPGRPIRPGEPRGPWPRR